MTNEHTSLEKYTSHTLFERVMYERWVGDWTNCNILTSSSFVFSSTSFLFCWATQLGVLRAHSSLLGAGSLYSILSPTNWLQLTEPVCSTGLYNCLMPTCLWTPYLHPIQPVHSQGYTLRSSTGCTSYLHRCISYLTAQPRVDMLQEYHFIAITTRLTLTWRESTY